MPAIETPSEPRPAVLHRSDGPKARLILLWVWGALVCLALIWIHQESQHREASVIRMVPGNAKSLAERTRETLELLRHTFHWAFAWILFGPFVVYLGTTLNLAHPKWRTRALLLLAGCVVFVAGSQWVESKLRPGEAVVLMVNYTNATIAGDHQSTNQTRVKTVIRATLTNRFATPDHLDFHGTNDFLETIDREIDSIRAGFPGLTNLPPIPELESKHGFGATRILGNTRWPALLDAFAYCAMIGIAHAGVFHRKYREREQQAVALEGMLNQARLRSLQAQLQPHFLFNTLNGIATLLRRDPLAAEEMLTSLSDLLRIALDGSKRQEIPLHEEVEFVERYLAIQRMRFGERLNSEMSIPPETRDCLVPSLVLQPLVENAIRHGIEPSGKPGTVRIVAHCLDGLLRLSVEDNGVGLSHPAAADVTTAKTGLGIANVRDRLAALYGDAHRFELVHGSAAGLTVQIEIPIRKASGPGESPAA